MSLLVASCVAAQENVISIMPEPDHCFLSVVRLPLRIDVKTSTEVSGRHLGHGDIHCVDGKLVSVRLRFQSGRVLRYTMHDLRRIVARAHVDTTRSDGGWLVEARGLAYVSNARYQRSRTDE
jgi:hypothetical protein